MIKIQLIGTCSAGFTGFFCEIPLLATPTTTTTTTTTTVATTSGPTAESCPSAFADVCKNGGICLILDGATFFCRCPSSIGGYFCENILG